MKVYELEQVTKQYPQQPQPANREITLQIEAGEIFGLLGDNGAGKTTLVRQMVNLQQPTTGVIKLFGRPVAADPIYAAKLVGYMPQDANALNNLTVGEALYFTGHLRGLSRYDAQRERDQLLETWQIGELRDKYSSKLSGGQRRLLRLVVAIAGGLPVLILDEPTNDLDPQRRRMVWENLRQLNQATGTTIIFITHDAIEAEKIIERVGIMRAGELVAVGRPTTLKQQVAQQLRLELLFPPHRPPSLPQHLTSTELQPGRWLTWLNREEVGVVLNGLDLAQLDDFRLTSATLEDLYVHYTNQAGTAAAESTIS
ncbi:MAG: ABC transporter ATP-binding protein [Caldilineaceae bacterium]|nr:ABC transporter ATP-binding protein [Caldilineaceae bacterium]